ncbi:MAG: hypothetical protein ACKOX6_16890 [Bdellovibrio sp.]
MYSKADIFNLALGALLLNKKIINPDDDKSPECQVLNTHFNSAFLTTLQDMDLDSTSTQKDLELLEEDPNSLWKFAYKYPSDCAFFRRIQNGYVTDRRSNQIKRRVAIHDGKKVIFTNQECAVAEYISSKISIEVLSPNAGLAVAYQLAILSAPLVAGKGAGNLRKEIEGRYGRILMQAKQQDKLENANFEEEDFMSEFVEARLE